MFLRFAKPCCSVLGLAAAAFLFAGCGGSPPELPPAAGGGAPIATGGEENGTAPSTSQDARDPGDMIPPAVKEARDVEPGTDLIPGAEGKKVETGEGAVTVKKLPDGSVVDEHDGKAHPR